MKKHLGLSLIAALLLALLGGNAFAQCKGYCAADKAPPTSGPHGGPNRGALCIQVLQSKPDAVVLQLFDGSGNQMRLNAEGKEKDRWRPDVVEREGGKIYPDRSVFDDVDHAVLCNGKHSVALSRRDIDRMLEHNRDSCPSLQKHFVCLANAGYCRDEAYGK